MNCHINYGLKAEFRNLRINKYRFDHLDQVKLHM